MDPPAKNTSKTGCRSHKVYLNAWVTEIGGCERIQTNVNSSMFDMDCPSPVFASVYPIHHIGECGKPKPFRSILNLTKITTIDAFVFAYPSFLREPHIKPKIQPAKRRVYLCTTTCPGEHILRSNGCAIARTILRLPP